MVTEWTSSLTRDEALTQCEAGQVPCGPVYGIDEIFEDPHYAARHNIVDVEDGRAGTVSIPNVVPQLSATPGGIKWLGPALGEHNAEIYGTLLGFDAARIKALEKADRKSTRLTSRH